jgi:hypothetical protein
MRTRVDAKGLTRWPTAADYQAAIQLAVESADSGGLTAGLEFQRADFDLEMLEGSAGYVFHAKRGRNQYALKVFSKHVPDRRERYRHIHDHLEKQRSRIFIDFQFADHGVWVTSDMDSADWFPAVRMQWCGGQTLEVAVDQALQTGYDGSEWARDWLRVLRDLRKTGTAHGDLQHGNVIVGSNGRMRLIDYDGMFVPSMDGHLAAVELGHPAFQHPARQMAGAPFDAYIDGVSGLVILASLGGLTTELWDMRDDEGLLLGSDDLAAPNDSELLSRLSRSPEPAPQLVRLLRQALAKPLGPCPELDEAAQLYGLRLPAIARRTPIQRSQARAPRVYDDLPATEVDLAMQWENDLRGVEEPEPVSPVRGAAPPKLRSAADTGGASRPFTALQLVTLLSASAGLDATAIAALRARETATVRRQLATIGSRLGGREPKDVLGFRLTAREAQVIELRHSGQGEAACARRLGIQPSTARRHLGSAIGKIERSKLQGAQELSASLRSMLEADKRRRPKPSSRPRPSSSTVPSSQPAAAHDEWPHFVFPQRDEPEDGIPSLPSYEDQRGAQTDWVDVLATVVVMAVCAFVVVMLLTWVFG